MFTLIHSYVCWQISNETINLQCNNFSNNKKIIYPETCGFIFIYDTREILSHLF